MADVKNTSTKFQMKGRIEGPPVINIACPAYGSQFCGEFVSTIFSLLNSKQKPDRRYQLTQVDYGDIAEARNYLISNFYYNLPNATHLLFIDNDMGCEASLISRMLELEEDVVGIMAPRRKIDLKRLHESAHLPFEKALANAVDFIGVPTKPQVEKKGFLQVKQCGTGILLISRNCIDKMISQLPEIVDEPPFLNNSVRQKFNAFLTPFERIKHQGFTLSEDLSFCNRWVRECKGEIYACTDARVFHVGQQTVDSRYSDQVDLKPAYALPGPA